MNRKKKKRRKKKKKRVDLSIKIDFIPEFLVPEITPFHSPIHKLSQIERKGERERAQLYGQECLIDVTTLEVGGSSGRHFFMSFINELSLLLFVSRFDC